MHVLDERRLLGVAYYVPGAGVARRSGLGRPNPDGELCRQPGRKRRGVGAVSIRSAELVSAKKRPERARQGEWSHGKTYRVRIPSRSSSGSIALRHGTVAAGAAATRGPGGE